MFRIFNEQVGNLRNRAKQSNNNAPHECAMSPSGLNRKPKAIAGGSKTEA
jgi:hypothetical protein